MLKTKTIKCGFLSHTRDYVASSESELGEKRAAWREEARLSPISPSSGPSFLLECHLTLKPRFQGQHVQS